MSYDPNEMMLDLFRAEVESHSDSLTNSLLKLEQDPTDTDLLNGMMRAAHSIKGAARIVRVDAAVAVAHVMEDCFVAAQRGELVLQPAGIDILLRSVDLLVQVSEASKNPAVDWEAFQPAITSTVSQLRNVLRGQPIVEEERGSMPPPAAPGQIANPPPAIEAQLAENLPSPPPAASSAPLGMPAPRICIPQILNHANAESIRVQLLSALDEQSNHNPVIIDLSRTQDLDAVGLALLQAASTYASTQERSLRFEHASDVLSRIFQAVGIGSMGSATGIGNKGIQDGQ